MAPVDVPVATAGAELIVTAQQAMMTTERAVNQLVRMLREQNTPAELHEVPLTQAEPKKPDQSGRTALSVGFYNPSAATIYTTINGGAPEPGRDSLSIPPRSLLVLPIPCSDVGLGVDPADPAVGGGAVVTVYVLRFDTVQPAFLGRTA